MVKQDQVLLQTKPVNIHNLYETYAGMLLGYIFEIVKDKKEAEDYLVKVFTTIATIFNPNDGTKLTTGANYNAWLKLN